MVHSTSFNDTAECARYGRQTKKNPRHSLEFAGFSHFEGGGAEGNRTPDLKSASLALSQLSYGPGNGAGH
jgi:hypothetical protein